MKRFSNDYGSHRTGYDQNGGGGKRGRFDSYQEALSYGKYEFRALITSKGAGGVIGKSGENIKRLRNEFDPKPGIDYPSTKATGHPINGLPTRYPPVLTITATIENVLQCLHQVIPRLDENRLDDRDRNNMKSSGPESEMKVLIHESHAGAVIGRSGSRIKELREKAGVQLKVFSQCAPQSTERVVVICGEVDKIIDCVSMIIEILKEIPIKGITRPYDPSFYDANVAADYGGYPADRGFRGPRYRAPVEPPNRGYNNYGGGMSNPRDDHYNGREPDMRSSYRSIPPNGPTTTTQVTIPDELGGAIIGKGGSRINRVREESGAQIDVEPQRGSGDDRIITITGTRDQIQAAQYLLQQCIRTSEAGRRYLSVH